MSPSLDPQHDSAPGAVAAARGASLAVVDDDPGALTALTFLLEVEGYRIRAFRDGDAFLQSARADLPDCLVLDQNMPSLSGLEVVDRLNRAGIRLPIVMITATPSGELARRAMAAGVDCIVEKPLFGSALGDAIEASLAKKKTSDS